MVFAAWDAITVIGEELIMSEIGEFLGWVTVVCYIISICTFIVKQGNKLFISRLPKESQIKKYYMLLMKLIIKCHMYFGISAGIFAVIHYFVQTSSGHDSVTGTILMVAMVITVIIGATVKFTKGSARKHILVVHRTAVAFVLLMVILHLIIH